MAQVEPPQVFEPELDNGEVFIHQFLEQYPDLAAKIPDDLESLLPKKDASTMTLSLLDKHTRDNFQEAYNVTSSPRGRCLIINNRYFNDKNLGERLGTDRDRDSLRDLFKRLNYDVTIEDNLGADQIVSVCNKFILDREFERFDSCVLCILSHGYKERIYGSDGKTVKENEILDIFNNPACKLNGKPKLVIIQACRIAMKNSLLRFCFGANAGDTTEEGPAIGDVKKIIEHLRKLNMQDGVTLQDAVPKGSDILIAYSTLPGMVSWRNQNNGSWFIQAIVLVFESRSSSEHVADMMVMVRNVVEKAFGGWQIPCAINNLRMKFFFFPATC